MLRSSVKKPSPPRAEILRKKTFLEKAVEAVEEAEAEASRSSEEEARC